MMEHFSSGSYHSSSNSREYPQQRFLDGKGAFLCLILSAAAFLGIAALSVFLTQYHAKAAVDAGEFQNIRYISGTAYEDVDNNKNEMSAIRSLSDIRKNDGDKFVHVSFSIPSSDYRRVLDLYSYFSQIEVQFDSNRVSDSITLSNVYYKSARERFIIEPSKGPVAIDVIIKCKYSPKLDAFIASSDNPGTLSAWNLWIVSFAVLSGISLFLYLLSVKRLRTSGYPLLLGFCIAPVLLFLGSAICIVSLSLTGSLLFLMRIGFAVILISDIFFINFLFKKAELSDNARQLTVGLGLIGTTMTLTGQYQAITIALIQCMGLYFPVCLLCISACIWLKHKRYRFTAAEEIFCVWLTLTHTVLCTYFLFHFDLNYLYIPLFVCVLFFLTYTVSSSIDRKPQTETDKNSPQSAKLLMYKPENIGRIGDLLEIFLQNQEYRIHACNVSLYVHVLCRNSGMSEEQSVLNAQAAFLHDIGKMMVPKKLTDSKSNFTDYEYDEMKKHALYGYDLFAGYDSDLMKTAAIIAKEHHERIDGNGYYGLSDDQIHDVSQIVAIADVFDATTTKRSYKKAWSFNEGFEYIQSNSGTLFAKQYVDVFVNSREDIYTIYCNAEH